MSGLSQRIITGILFVLVVIAATFAGIRFFVPLVALFTILCSRELLNIMTGRQNINLLRRGFSIALSLIPMAIVLCPITATISDMRIVLMVLGLVMSLILIIELFGQSEKPFDVAAANALTLLYIGVPFALLVDIALTSSPYDPILLLSIFLFTWANDTGAYFVGSLIGRKKLFVRISPKKTVEGAIGGLIVCALIGLLMSTFSESLGKTEFVILSIIVSVTATIGDLIESMLKRSRGIKDSGTGLPGHGGYLDRFDGFIYATPFAYFYLSFFV